MVEILQYLPRSNKGILLTVTIWCLKWYLKWQILSILQKEKPQIMNMLSLV